MRILLPESAAPFAGPLAERATEDGPQAYIVYCVGFTYGNNVMCHFQGFTSMCDAGRFADKVNARGIVDLAHWEAMPTAEELLEAEFTDEQEDRRRWGALA